MKILTAHSVDTLRIESFKNPKVIFDPMEDLIARFKLVSVEVPVEVDSTALLQLLCDEKDKFSGDRTNVPLVRNAIQGMDALSATDERFWLSITVGNANSYAAPRWFDPAAEQELQATAVSNHWFARTSRDFIRNQAIARLWWLGEYVESLDTLDIQDALEVLFWNSDLQSQFVGRPTSMSSRKVGASILGVMKEVKDSGVTYDREKFRRLCSAIDLKLGRQLLPGLGHQQLDDVIRSVAKKLYALP